MSFLSIILTANIFVVSGGINMKTPKQKQVTLQFATLDERNEFIRWYSGAGSTHFFCHLCNKGGKYRRIAELKEKHFPKRQEKWV